MSTTLPQPHSSSRSWLLIALWCGVTIALAFALPSLPWQQALTEARRVATGWIGVAILANFVILPLWALEWRILVPGASRVSFATMFEIVAITAAVLNSIPFLAGEISAVALLVRRARLARGAALSVLAMDQLLVAFAKLGVLGAAAIIAPVPGWLRSGVLTLVAVLAGLLFCLLPLAHRWERAQARLLAVPTRARILLADLVSWGHQLDALRDGGRAWRVATLAMAKKLAELSAILAVQMAFGLQPSVSSALLVLAALALSTMVPVAPANLGVYEATTYAVYRYSGVSGETALGLAIVQHLCFLLPSLATGYVMLSLRQLVSRRMRAR